VNLSERGRVSAGAKVNEEAGEGSNKPDSKKERNKQMKKLMIASLAACAVSGAFAAPLVYDYKASVKHMYEKVQKVKAGEFYVKYVKSSKLQGYFVQDFDGASLLANNEATGNNYISQKRGFLVLINKSAEKDYRAPKIMPAQLDVKKVVTKVKSDGAPASSIAETYFYAGSFVNFIDANNGWDGDYDESKDYLFSNGVTGVPGAGIRTYGTAGSTIYLFGQHNTFNQFTNLNAPPATDTLVYAFGDAWLNGAGFGTIGTPKTTLCCGWTTSVKGGNIKSVSGNLKGGLFLCSTGGEWADSDAWFALGLEDIYKNDVGNAAGKVKQGYSNANPEDPQDQVAWSDGDIALSTTDVVSGSWTLKPASNKFKAVALTADERDAEVGGNKYFPNVATTPKLATLLANIKAANQALDKNYSLLTSVEPRELAGAPTEGLISYEFANIFIDK
jgi:hypothetical protein